MSKKITDQIPNMITLCNLLSGCVAVYMTFHSAETFGALTGLQWAWISIAAAALFDFCDGAAARALRAYSEIGRELDSLADLVSFGVAPGMMMLNLMQSVSPHPWIAFVALIIPLMGAYRLAKFNVDTTQTTTFRGLPIPANAIFWIGFSAWISNFGYIGDVSSSILIVLVSSLMIGNIRMFSLKFKNFNLQENFRRYVLIIATLMFLVFFGVSGLMWTIALYFLISVLGRKELQS